jgi:hypothetical protein
MDGTRGRSVCSTRSPRALSHRTQRCSVGRVPKLWLYTQIAIIVFVLAGMVIAITKLV